MAEVKYIFPQGFEWGTATSAYQVEGNNPNSNWALFEEIPGVILNGDRNGSACDWWNGARWKDDFSRAGSYSQNAHRLSVEWARIQPRPDQWDEEALDYYREIIRGLVSNGLKPMVTLHHFSNPIWFSEIGGWENPDAPLLFERYVEKTVQTLKQLVSCWVPINEPNVYVVNTCILGVFPPQKKMNLKAAVRSMVHMLRGHAAAYETIHRLQPEASVGTSINIHGFIPAQRKPADRFLTAQFHRLFNCSFLELVEKGFFSLYGYPIREKKAMNTQDFIGINYYTTSQIQFSTDWTKIMTFADGTLLSDTGFIGHEPEFFEKCLVWAAQFKKPVYVTENGTENQQDQFRRTYLAEHLIYLWKAISKGVPVKGYYHWSLVDNFEWERGWYHKFGLWELDRETQRRSPRQSAEFFKQIAAKNMLDSEDLMRFAPDVYQRSVGD